MDEDRSSEARAYFDQDSKRYHRFILGDNEDRLVGTIYVPKSMDPIPERVMVELEVRGLLPKEGEDDE